MSYRFSSPSQVFFNLAGTAPIPGGSWSFFITNTTTPKTTYSNESLTVSNSNPVLLDASARLTTNVWLDGDYTAELKDANNVVVWNGDITSGAPAGLSIPALAPGFLTNDLSNLQWSDINLLPDPTGSAQYMVVVNGSATGYALIPQPTAPTIPQPEVIVTATTALEGFRAGISSDPTKFYLQSGNSSAAASGTKSTTASVTFATPFSTTPHVMIETSSGFVTQAGSVQPTVSVTNKSVTGFTVQFSTQTGEGNADNNITIPVAFDWVAFGTLEVPIA